MAIRVPRGYARRHPAYQEVMEGIRPTLKWLKAAAYLPIVETEPRTDDPIVLPAGTWVGVANLVGTGLSTGGLSSGSFNSGTSYTLGSSGAYFLVPAASRAYTLTYTSADSSTTFHSAGVVNIDGLGTAPAAGVSVGKVGYTVQVTGGGVKPLGVLYKDVKASWLKDQYTNYDPELPIGLLCKNQVIQVPCVTQQEMDIEPGDTVVMAGWDQASLTWDPTATPAAANAVGRLRRLQDFTVTGQGTELAVSGLRSIMEHRVGKCLRKILIANAIGASQGTKLATAISAGTISAAAQVNHEFRSAGRVQTVPGLGLQGSGTLGLPGHLLNARAGALGSFWALEIMVDTY